MNDLIIDALVTIGNTKKVKEICEPNIFECMELKRWMVVRTLTSLNLFEDEMTQKGVKQMKYFVSGKFEDRENIRKLQQALRDKGYDIVEDWTYHEYTDKGYPFQYAEDDIKGVSNCDVYVGRFISDYNYKGALVEMGAALALNKKVCIIGHAIDSCIFVSHPLVSRFETESEFLMNE